MMAALFGCLFAGVSTVQAQEVTPDEVGYIVKVGDEAPDFEMTLTDGQKVKLSSSTQTESRLVINPSGMAHL